MGSQEALGAAIDHLCATDPVVAELVARLGPLRPTTGAVDGPFAALVRTIVAQQLSGRAAETIVRRVEHAVGGTLTPESIALAPDGALRGAGLSTNKVASIRDLAAKVADGSVDLSPSSELGDDEIAANLMSVRGIGRWTAEVFLIFELGRLDVWPVGDLRIRLGFGTIFEISPPPRPQELAGLADRFRPYRSVLARYCWEVLSQ